MALTSGASIVAPDDAKTTWFTGSGTWTKRNTVRAVRVWVIGGGGGSGGCNSAGTGAAASGAGGGGGWSTEYILASALGATEAVTVGAGGTAGASGTNAGGTGGTSSFGTAPFLSATGGTGGAGGVNSTAAQTAAGGTGGTGSGGDGNGSGGDGCIGLIIATAGALRVANGGETPFGMPTKMSATVATPVTGHTYGGGAPGVFTTSANSAGGVGGAGVVIVEEIY